MAPRPHEHLRFGRCAGGGGNQRAPCHLSCEKRGFGRAFVQRGAQHRMQPICPQNQIRAQTLAAMQCHAGARSIRADLRHLCHKTGFDPAKGAFQQRNQVRTVDKVEPCPAMGQFQPQDLLAAAPRAQDNCARAQGRLRQRPFKPQRPQHARTIGAYLQPCAHFAKPARLFQQQNLRAALAQPCCSRQPRDTPADNDHVQPCKRHTTPLSDCPDRPASPLT